MHNNRREFLKSASLPALAAGPLIAQVRRVQTDDRSSLPAGNGKARKPHVPDTLGGRLAALRAKTGQKITSIETFVQGTDLCIVRIRTEDGAEGFGQTAPLRRRHHRHGPAPQSRSVGLGSRPGRLRGHLRSRGRGQLQVPLVLNLPSLGGRGHGNLGLARTLGRQERLRPAGRNAPADPCLRLQHEPLGPARRRGRPAGNAPRQPRVQGVQGADRQSLWTRPGPMAGPSDCWRGPAAPRLPEPQRAGNRVGSVGACQGLECRLAAWDDSAVRRTSNPAKGVRLPSG